MSLVYLASPYSHPEPEIKEQRFKAAMAATALLMRKGVVVFSPIVHCHHISVDFKLPGDFTFWKKYDEQMMMRSDYVIFLLLPGWENSKGMAAEWEFTLRAGIPYKKLKTIDLEKFDAKSIPVLDHNRAIEDSKILRKENAELKRRLLKRVVGVEG